MQKIMRTDRFGSVVVYPDGARNIEAIAKHEWTKMTGIQEPKIAEISFNDRLNVYVAIFKWEKVKKNLENKRWVKKLY